MHILELSYAIKTLCTSPSPSSCTVSDPLLLPLCPWPVPEQRGTLLWLLQVPSGWHTALVNSLEDSRQPSLQKQVTRVPTEQSIARTPPFTGALGSPQETANGCGNQIDKGNVRSYVSNIIMTRKLKKPLNIAYYSIRIFHHQSTENWLF